jgi:hypothetical protein
MFPMVRHGENSLMRIILKLCKFLGLFLRITHATKSEPVAYLMVLTCVKIGTQSEFFKATLNQIPRTSPLSCHFFKEPVQKLN